MTGGQWLSFHNRVFGLEAAAGYRTVYSIDRLIISRARYPQETMSLLLAEYIGGLLPASRLTRL